MVVKKLVVNKVFSDSEMKEMEGTWIDESHIKHPVINDNTDVYYIDDNGDEKLLLKFRKGVITDNELRIGWHSYKDLAKPARGRGASAGPIDFEGQQVFEKRESINRHGKIYDDAGDEFAWKKAAHSRLGGHQFVMDDGTPVKREGTKDVGTIENELIRLRTRSGAQLLLHNSESLVYITNSSGTAWIEFTADGKIDIHADDSVSIHTNSDFNMRAERDINMEAGRNINIKAIGNNENEIKNSDPSLTAGRLHLDGVNIEMYAHKDTDDVGGDIKIKAENDHSLYATNNFHVEAGADVKVYATANGLIETGTNFKMFGTSSISLDSDGDINFNSGIVSANVVGASLSEVIAQLDTYNNERIPNGSETEPDPKSIVKRLPTREPYANHENKRQKFATAEMTDRERPDKRKEEE